MAGLIIQKINIILYIYWKLSDKAFATKKFIPFWLLINFLPSTKQGFLFIFIFFTFIPDDIVLFNLSHNAYFLKA